MRFDQATDPLGMQRILLGAGGGTLWEDSSFGFATSREVGWELPSRANAPHNFWRLRSLVVIMNGTTQSRAVCSLDTVHDLQAAQDEPGLPGILGITECIFGTQHRAKRSEKSWKGKRVQSFRGRVYSLCSPQLYLPSGQLHVIKQEGSRNVKCTGFAVLFLL